MSPTLSPGDICITGENRYPRFRVIALNDDRVWVRDVETGRDSVVLCEQCHKVEDGENASQAHDTPPAPPPAPHTREGAPMPADASPPTGPGRS